MSKPAPFYADGYPSPDIELTVLPSPQYPFLRNPIPDKYSVIQPRAYNVLPALYTPRLANRTSWTNILTRSEDFTHADWSAFNVTITANQAVAPDGSTTMDKVLETVTNGAHGPTHDVTLAAVAYEASIFAAGGLGRDWLYLLIGDSAAAFFSAFFNITNGYIGTVSANTTARIVPMGGGRFQCTIGFTPAAGLGAFDAFLSTNGIVASYAGDVTKGFYLWGAQIVAGVMPPYVSTTTIARTVSAPDREVAINANARAQDPLSYLVDETDPIMITSAFGDVRRKFARIPRDQATPGSRSISKPTIPNEATTSPSLRAFGASTTEIATAVRNNTGFWSSDDRVFANFVSISASTTASDATAGTFTLTYKASTTAGLNYNANNATIAVALNALASVISDGLVFSVATSLSGNVGGFIALTVTTGATTTAVTMAVAGLTVTPVSGKFAFTHVGSSTLQYVQLARTLTVPAHGFATAASRSLLLVSTVLNEGYVLPDGSWAVYDANTLQLSEIFTTGITTDTYGVLTYAAPFLRSYTPGVTQISSRITERYYLPGVSVGITTSDDIPVEQPVIADAALIAAILAGGGFQTINFDGPSQWLGPLLRTVETEVDLDDL